VTGNLTSPHQIDNSAGTYFVEVSSINGTDDTTRFEAVRALYRLQVSPAPAVPPASATCRRGGTRSSRSSRHWRHRESRWLRGRQLLRERSHHSGRDGRLLEQGAGAALRAVTCVDQLTHAILRSY
jgi:hypothetical protein